MTNRTSWLFAALATTTIAIGGCQNEGHSENTASAAPSASAGSRMGTGMNDEAKTELVLRQLHAINQAEIDTGRLAQDKAQNADVKNFANQMVSDHVNLDQKLTDAAKRDNIDLSKSSSDPLLTAFDAAADQSKNNLRGESGPRFDVVYMAPQVADHIYAANVIEEGIKTATGDTKQVLQSALPVVNSHAEHARKIEREMVLPAGAVGGGPAGSSEPGGASPMRRDGGVSPHHQHSPGMDQGSPSGGSKGTTP